MRMTKQKKLILEIVNNSYEHLDAKTVYDECMKLLPNISLGTVYRNLNLLVSDKKIKKIKNGDIFRFDAIRDKHNHLFCIKCGKIIDVYENIVIPNKELFCGKILDYEINFTGICGECMKEEEENNGIKRK